ncbi:MAG TPA: NAD(P)/FAD-dependent oxidoreductase [Variovorax sp.]|nr:NAD(P)/FAD-dependent oxidoreductase [Variovorax sp.]
MNDLDCVVVGAGVVGLAVARALALQGREVMVLEATSSIGTGISSRSSEVIHAGMYYPQGSLKARLCVQGRSMLYEYVAERGIPHQRCGKLIVATSEPQTAYLQKIMASGIANGISDLSFLTAGEARALEPQLECTAALHSPSTGIIDSHALMLAYQGDIEGMGGMVVFHSGVERGRCEAEGIELTLEDGTLVRCRTLINSAGLGAPLLARNLAGLPLDLVPTPYYAKGSYFTLTGKAPFDRLIYPVPEAAGLGVHLTLDLGGQARFGPDVEWVSSPDDLVVDPARCAGFYAEVRRYWPALKDDSLIPAYAGMRPKISGPGVPAEDFRIQGPAVHGVPGLVNLFGIESPGLTSSLAIGAHVARMLEVV